MGWQPQSGCQRPRGQRRSNTNTTRCSMCTELSCVPAHVRGYLVLRRSFVARRVLVSKVNFLKSSPPFYKSTQSPPAKRLTEGGLPEAVASEHAQLAAWPIYVPGISALSRHARRLLASGSLRRSLGDGTPARLATRAHGRGTKRASSPAYLTPAGRTNTTAFACVSDGAGRRLGRLHDTLTTAGPIVHVRRKQRLQHRVLPAVGGPPAAVAGEATR